MELDGVDVRVLPTRAESGAMNMALDAVAAETVRSGGPASVRVYEWNPSTLSLGYAQDPATVDWGYCETEGIEVTRRPTGGGGIYHDEIGDIAYSIVLPRECVPGDLMDAYSVLCEPVVSALEHMGVRVSFATDQQPAMYEPACYLRDIHPAHDLVTTTPAGELKISGNAQHRVRDAVIQHGSLVYLHRPDRHLACFTDCPVDARAYGTRVASIEDQGAVDREAAIAHLEDALIEWSGATPGAWTEAERARARDVVQETFGNPDWVQHRVDSRAHA